MAVVTPRTGAASLRLGTRSKVRAQWLLLAAALTVLAGAVVAWGLSRAAARTDVVATVRDVAVGAELSADDLTVVAVAVADGVTGLVPAASLGDLVGRVTAIPLAAGSLVTAGTWVEGAELAPGEQAVGAVLRLGRLPERLGAGRGALAVALTDGVVAPQDDAVDGAGLPEPVPVRVITERRLETGETSLVLAVAAADAPAVARLAATELLVLVGLPGQPAVTEEGR